MPHPNPQNLCLCYLIRQKGLTDVIKLRVLSWVDYLKLSGELNVIPRVLMRGRQEGLYQRDVMLKQRSEGTAVSPGMLEASRR